MTHLRHRETLTGGDRSAVNAVTALAGLNKPPEWTVDALCAQTDPEIFFPDKGASVREAKTICAACPVRAQCLDYALLYKSNPFGVWGGLSAVERRNLRRNA